MSWGAVMTAMSFISVPHWGHSSGSTSKIFRSKRAQEARLAGERKEAESGSSGSEREARLSSGVWCWKAAWRVRFA